MTHKRKDLTKSHVELEITVQPDEYQKHMVKAAERISNRVKVEGFRPGKAPYEIVKHQVGEMNIMQEALEDIVQSSFYQAVDAEKLETVGMPKIDLDKMAPGNELTYKATVSLLPTLELPDLKKITVKREVKEVTDAQVDEDLENLVVGVFPTPPISLYALRTLTNYLDMPVVGVFTNHLDDSNWYFHQPHFDIIPKHFYFSF